ncbi:MAG: hypothetical protein HY903_19905 [Deltaproteobacteria bacterium]|nr:hypothetical protein [Deltaproteobacteria bacterium]
MSSAGPLDSGNRLSPVTTALNERISGGIDAKELQDLKDMAAGGVIPFVDIDLTLKGLDGQNLSPEVHAEVKAALEQMLPIAQRAAGAQSDAIAKTLGIIDTVNPFAYVRALFGGERVGIGQTW